MKGVLLLVVLASAFGPSLAAADHIRCEDAPYLPGALSGYYDMWNNIYRHYKCGHIVDANVIHVQVLLP